MKLARIGIASVVLAASLAVTSVSPVPVLARGPRGIDISQRQSVIDSYMAEFERAEPAMEFTGNVSTCTPGTTSMAYQLSVLQRANWYRQMAGLPEVVYNSANHAAAQAGALISAAEKTLSHTPSATAKCYTSLGYTGTSSSNLALGGAGVKAIDMYINDFGDNNTDVGHRRWILSPELRGLATGDIPRQGSASSFEANALYVFDRIAAVTPRDGGVAWPPPGYVPDKVVFARWSYVRLGANFSNAQVTVVGPNGPVPVVVESRANFMGAGIVFTPTIPAARNADTQYTVTITGITGAPNSTINYNVTIVPINKAPRLIDFDVSGHSCSGREVFISPYFTDDESDQFSIEYADGSGDANTFELRATRSGTQTYYTLVPKKSLDPLRTTYSFALGATDSFGASRLESVTATIPTPSSRILCNPQTITMKRTKFGTTVKWTTVPLGAKATRFVVRVGSKTCSTSKTNCSVKGLKKGRYTVSVTASRSGSQSVTARQTIVLR